MRTTVLFRGVECDVEFTIIDEPDVNFHSVEWHFPDLTPEEHAALNVTEEEGADICTTCCDAASTDNAGCDEYGSEFYSYANSHEQDRP